MDAESGVIVEVGPAVSRPPADRCAVINAVGFEVTPGLVDAHTHLGVQEPFWGGGDANEATSPLNPHLHILDARDPLDPNLRDAAAGGVTAFAMLPGAPISFGDVVEAISVIAGRGAVVRLRLLEAAAGDEPPALGETRRREDRGKLAQDLRGWIDTEVLRAEAGVKLALGEHPKRFFAQKGTPPATRMNLVALLREALAGARDDATGAGTAAADGPRPPRDLKREALARLLAGDYPAHIHVHRVRDIELAVRLVEEFGFQAVLHHVTEGHLCSDRLAEKGLPCVVGPIAFSRRGSELRHLTPATPAALWRAGVKVAITTDHPTFPAHYLPIHAGMAVREGLPEAEALRAITINPAEILGVADRVGSLEPGKDADVVLWRGHPLDAITPVATVIIGGRVALDSRDAPGAPADQGGER